MKFLIYSDYLHLKHKNVKNLIIIPNSIKNYNIDYEKKF